MPSYRGRQIVGGLIFLLSLLLFPSMLSAQVEKRVVFAKGKYSATYRGSLPRNYTDYDAFYFRAKRGQTLSVKLVTADPQAYVMVYETKDEIDPTEDVISPREEYPRALSGRLPVTSEYSVQIYGVRSSGQHSNRAAYTIEITIR